MQLCLIMGGVAAAVALARKGKDLAAEMPRFAEQFHKRLIYSHTLLCVCYICDRRCVWIEKNGLVLVVISEKVKGIKWFCVCKSAGQRCCPRAR